MSIENLYTKTLEKWRSTFQFKDEDGGMKLHACFCDHCHHWIIGVRYKCLICPNYDLCHGCANEHKSTQHAMIRITSPTDCTWQWCFFWTQAAINDKNNEFSNLIYFILKRKYVQDNLTFRQLKEMTFENANNLTNGVTMDLLEAFYKEVQNISSQSTSFACDCCNVTLLSGIRFTCITCMSFDLCESCEKAHKHDCHPMIRICVPGDFSWLYGWFLAGTPMPYLPQTTEGDVASDDCRNGDADPGLTDMAVDNPQLPASQKPRKKWWRHFHSFTSNATATVELTTAIVDLSNALSK